MTDATRADLIAELSKWPTENLKQVVFEANTLLWKRALGRVPTPKSKEA